MQFRRILTHRLHVRENHTVELHVAVRCLITLRALFLKHAQTNHRFGTAWCKTKGRGFRTTTTLEMGLDLYVCLFPVVEASCHVLFHGFMGKLTAPWLSRAGIKLVFSAFLYRDKNEKKKKQK